MASMTASATIWWASVGGAPAVRMFGLTLVMLAATALAVAGTLARCALCARECRRRLRDALDERRQRARDRNGLEPGRALRRPGREQARQLGDRRRDDGIAVVFTSDLRRAVETAEIAFAGSPLPVVHDRRLRECNYGDAERHAARATRRRSGAGGSTSRSRAARAGGRRSSGSAASCTSSRGRTTGSASS